MTNRNARTRSSLPWPGSVDDQVPDLLLPLVPAVIGTGADPADSLVQQWALTVRLVAWCARRVLPLTLSTPRSHEPPQVRRTAKPLTPPQDQWILNRALSSGSPGAPALE